MNGDKPPVQDGAPPPAMPRHCPSTRAWRTRPGCTTTCSAARTISRPTGRPSRRALKIWPGGGLHRAGEPGVPRARRAATWPARRGCASSWTSAPASRRRATPTRSPRRSRRSPGSCTWTTTRSSSPTPARCWPATRQGATEYIDADLRDTPAILAQAARIAGLHPPGGGHAARHPARDPGLRRPARDRRHGCMDAVPSGSYLAISHMGSDLSPSRGSGESRTSRSRMSQQQFAIPQPRAGGAVLRRHGPGGARAGAGRGMASGPGAADAGESSLWCAVGRKR